MNKAAQRYPPQTLQPTMPIQRAMVCSISNQLATTGCQDAGTAYEIDLPADKIPTQACQVHGGEEMFARKFEDAGRKAAQFPNRLLQMLKKFVGGGK